MIRHERDIGIAVVGAQASARRVGFSRGNVERIGTGISELARNIIKFAPDAGGDILLTTQDLGDRLRLTARVRDNGPGITNIDKAMQAHYSTSGTLGLGLPGVKRLMDEFSIISVPGSGTVVTIAMEQ